MHKSISRPTRRYLSHAITLALLASNSAFAAEFVVQTNGDAGGGIPVLASGNTYTIDTLRSAIEQAESGAFPNADTINFASTLTMGGPVTISLTTVGDTFTIFGLISDSAFGISTDITIQGTGTAADIALDAGALRHFQVNNTGILQIGSLTLSGGSTPQNSSGRGGALLVGTGGDLTLNNSVITGNIAHTGGGVNVEPGGTATIRRSEFRSNSTTGTFGNGTGGAIFARGTTEVIDCTIEQNTANYSGGGIFSSGMLTITGTTLSNNTAQKGGGGLAGNNEANIQLLNSTLSGNSTPSSGGGIKTAGVSLSLINSTIIQNSATAGGGISDGGYSGITLHNTLVAGNTIADGAEQNDLSAVVDATSSNNLIGVETTSFTGISDGVNGNQIGTLAMPLDPVIGSLQNNGGPTLTHKPLFHSPLIDAGDNASATALTTDQRGLDRVVNATVDIGAVETGPDFCEIGPVTFTGPQTLSGSPTYLSESTLGTSGDVTVSDSGIITFVANNSIELGNGFSVTPGGQITMRIKPVSCTP